MTVEYHSSRKSIVSTSRVERSRTTFVMLFVASLFAVPFIAVGSMVAIAIFGLFLTALGLMKGLELREANRQVLVASHTTRAR